MKLDRNKYLESRSLRPIKLLFALLAVNLILALIVWMFPVEGVPLAEGQNLKFISWSDLKGENNDVKTVDIERVIENVSPKEESFKRANTSMAIDNNDSLTSRIKAEIISSINYDSSHQKLITPQNRGIQLPPNNPNVLNTIIKALAIESKSKVVRILHYGDSQLEGDRITDYLRNRLQQLFGGEGPGIVLPKEPAATSRRSAFVSQSKNLKKKAIYTSGKKAPENKYGIGGATFLFSGSYAKFLGYDTIVSQEDSTKELSLVIEPKFSKKKQASSYLRVKNGYSGYKRARRYSSIKLIYNSTSPFLVNFTSDNFVKEYVVNQTKGIGIKTWNSTTTKQLKLDFVKGQFPDIYGLA
ncbi:MAG: hypothetical protein HKP14_06390, partial [Bacteroidia bacterium]|nr:hypothetical protein [Bacteroidia bacterium]